MKSRRNFLIQGSLATTAMFLLKPLENFAGITSPFTRMSHNNKLIFLHTGNFNDSNNFSNHQYIQDIKNKNSNAILVNAGKKVNDQKDSLDYDVCINRSEDLSTLTGEYKIINKGNVRTGIISAKPGEMNVSEKINSLSTYLKKEKNCTLVVCLSQLGYKNKNTVDDITLANNSTDLDIIISGHAQNYHQLPIIALNSKNAEVIIHSPVCGVSDFGKIEIDFDENGRKRHISLTNHSKNNIS